VAGWRGGEVIGWRASEVAAVECLTAFRAVSSEIKPSQAWTSSAKHEQIPHASAPLGETHPQNHPVAQQHMDHTAYLFPSALVNR